MENSFPYQICFFESLIMNFGLCGTLLIFQNYINDIFYGYINTFYLIYIDNIFIYNKTKKKHETRSTNFSEIAKNRFPIRHRQMRIFYQKYLNLIITPENIKINQKNSVVFD